MKHENENEIKTMGETIDTKGANISDEAVVASEDTNTPKKSFGLDSLFEGIEDDNNTEEILDVESLDISQIMMNAKKQAIEDLLKLGNDESLTGFIRHAMLELKEKDYCEAITTCKSGLEKYSENPELLSIMIRAYAENGDVGDANNTYSILQKISLDQYSFEVFSNLNDYLLLDVNANKSSVKQNIKNCKKVLPDEERAYVLECELWEKLKNHKKERKALLKGIKKHRNALNCALNLQKLQLEDADFKNALKTGYYISVCKTNLGVPGDLIRLDVSELQNCFCLKGIIFQKKWRNKNVSREEIEKVLTRFEKVKTEYPDVQHIFSEEIEAQEKALKLLLVEI